MHRQFVIALALTAGAVAGFGQELTLTLRQASEMAVKNNLQTVLAKERIAQAKGEKGVSLSFLLPNLAGGAVQANETSNLAAMGMTSAVFPGIPPFLGPYGVFDARIRLTQSIFNLAAIRRYQAGKYAVPLAEEQQRFATQQVLTAASLAYVTVLQQEQALESAHADVALARKLLDLATNQRNAGLATGLDVTRAETRLANQEVAQAQAETALDTARLELLRVVGAPLDSKLALADRMRFEPGTGHDVASVVAAAESERSDLRAAEIQKKIAATQYQAAVAGWAPSVSFAGDYGSSGVQPAVTSLPTRSVAVRIDIPIFDGGRTRAESLAASSVSRQAQAEASDLRAAVEKDVRQALDNLVTREAQVKAAQKALTLATRELELSEDRFRNGVADNIEVITAQTALENARQTVVASLAAFNVARLNLSAAMGRVQDFQL